MVHQNSSASSPHYYLQSAATGTQYRDTDWILTPENEATPSLLQSVYRDNQLQINENETGIFRYANWLPVHKSLNGSAATVTYKSTGLAESLGLNNLYIGFNGYWPEKEARMQTCSFKETEAYPVCGRFYPLSDKTLVVASAGNTARAFAHVCSENRIPVIIFVPERNFSALWSNKPFHDCVSLVAVSDADYLDAIRLSERVCDGQKYIPEGGVKNPARRDGMGTVILSAATTIGHIPDYYFQAIGSGSGAIAAWETNRRLLNDGRFGSNKMKLMVSQNKPFTPVYHAWRSRSRELDHEKIREEQGYIPKLFSNVLSNRQPAYSIRGGLYDALTDTSGDVLVVDNEAAAEASQLFAETEGIDIHPAAAVATASLIKQVREGSISHNADILLNITGGGEQRFKRDYGVITMKPNLTLDKNTSGEELQEALTDLVSA